MRRRYLISAVLLLLIACDATAPEPSTTVTVQTDVVIATKSGAGSVTWMSFTLPVAIRNAGWRPIHFEYCASAIEEPAGRGWRAVWTPICALAPATSREIQPGETRELPLSITAAVGGPGGPRWDSNKISGTYRFRAGLIPTGTRGVVPGVGSNAFVLAER
jgi:hypothetical protein